MIWRNKYLRQDTKTYINVLCRSKERDNKGEVTNCIIRDEYVKEIGKLNDKRCGEERECGQQE